MGEKEKGKTEDRRVALYKIHYECVRRNPEYAQAYQKINGYPIPPDMAHASLKWEWGISPYDGLPNPSERPTLDATLMRQLPRGDNSQGFPGEFRRHRGSEPMEFPKGKLVLEYFPEDEPHLPLCFVANMQWSEKYLKDRVIAWIERLYRLREKAGFIPPRLNRRRGHEPFREYIQEYEVKSGEKVVRFHLAAVRPVQRHRISEYRDFLRAYDFRHGGKRYREIGEKLWPNSDGDIERKARRYVLNGEDLVLNPPLKPHLFTGGL